MSLLQKHYIFIGRGGGIALDLGRIMADNRSIYFYITPVCHQLKLISEGG
jgi:glycerol dehydrogenase-like iron-containing ADH family enzyme